MALQDLLYSSCCLAVVLHGCITYMAASLCILYDLYLPHPLFKSLHPTRT